MLIKFAGPPKTIESHTQICPSETGNLDIDSLKHNINIDFEENSPQQRRCDI